MIAERFATRTQAEWAEVFEGTDACVAAIIPISEAKDHPHLKAREVYVERDGLLQPAPAPRFSRTRAQPDLAAVGAGGRRHPRGADGLGDPGRRRPDRQRRRRTGLKA